MAEKGTHVEFKVIATNAIAYQWLINGANIPGATNDQYCIDDVQTANVGTYSVVVTGVTGSTNSEPAHLAVYTLFCTNSTAGSLDIPVGWFGNQPYTCGGGTFDKGFSPTNGSLPAFFYGPNYPLANQVGPFRNTTYGQTLKIDTYHCDNGSADTGVKIQHNLYPTDLACNDTGSDPAPPGCHTAGAQVVKTLSTASNARYRLTVMYKNSAGPPTSGKVVYNWLYE